MNAPLPQRHAPQLLAERIPLEGTGAVDVERQRAVVAALKAFLPEHACSGARRTRGPTSATA